jgi:hypothetical protein
VAVSLERLDDPAVRTLSLFAKLVASGNYPKAKVIYDEWRHTFSIVYGTEQLQVKERDPKIEAIATAYQLQVGVEFPVLLFAVHTYYSLLMKMLATEVIVAQGGLGETFLGALARNELQQQLRELESGAILERHRIRNAIEEDFFGWYTEAWTPLMEKVLWQMAQKLADYDIAIKGKRTKYPVPYTVWTKTTRGFLPGGLTWEQADKRLASTEQIATPLPFGHR